MYLFILESIGTQELILVGVIALIIFGPRKLPEMMRSFGKAMAEFRRSTNEFKESWQKEVALEDVSADLQDAKRLLNEPLENSISRIKLENESENAIEPQPVVTSPAIREIDPEEFKQAATDIQIETAPKTEEKNRDLIDKRDWL
jgi:Tat protein translocase TatB subunit